MVEQNQVELAPFTTFGIPATCAHYLEIASEEEALSALSKLENEPFMVLGGGSNVLFTSNYNGTIIHNRIKGISRIREDEDYVYIRVGAGEVWTDVVEYALDQNLGGIENLSLIPGCAGAAPIQNIGAYGIEIKDVLESVTAVLLPNKSIRVFDHASCRFGYRDSIFKQELKGRFCITYLVLRLTKKHQLNTGYGAIREALNTIPESNWTIRDVSNAVISIRRSKLPDPAKLGNAGSFFKNPVIPTRQFNQLQEQFSTIPGYPVSENETKVPAGWLIEQCGWKGKQVGQTGCHALQALVIVNYGGASGHEIQQHAMNVINSVKERFNIELQPEVNIIEK
ncbi:MAG: UDP-N-acetylmuramate dehydrogenase [Flavobacteriales bacterium]|nr:UDP-N-acetylmuramate dehydrogenase [Flavobacteriales bacterium]